MAEVLPTAALTVLIVDDHPVVREGLRRLVEDSTQFSVCGEAEDGAKAMFAADDLQPDVILLDLSLPGRGGISLVESLHLRYPEIPILAISFLDESVYAERVLRAGALGFVSKTAPSEEILDALDTVSSRKIYLGPSARQQALNRIHGRAESDNRPRVETLSDRELDVFERIGKGQTVREIADALSLSVKTIESHRDKLRRKLGVRSSMELIAYAVRWRDSGP